MSCYLCEAVYQADRLLDAGASLEARDADGCTPLHRIAGEIWGEDLVHLLVTEGADVHATDNQGRTPLHEAAWSDQLEVVKLLVESDARIANRDHTHGGTCVDWARFAGKQRIVDYFASRDDLEIFDAIGCNRLVPVAWSSPNCRWG